MSSSLLHQAVELAQAGQREQARQMFLQFLQDEPDNEVAWLWVASVASDQDEYAHALNEVLRINPENPRARSLLDDYHRQYKPPAEGATSDSEAQFTRPAASSPDLPNLFILCISTSRNSSIFDIQDKRGIQFCRKIWLAM